MMMPDEQLRDDKYFKKMYSEGSVDIQFIPVVFRSKRKMHMQAESAHWVHIHWAPSISVSNLVNRPTDISIA